MSQLRDVSNTSLHAEVDQSSLIGCGRIEADVLDGGGGVNESRCSVSRVR